MYPRQITNQYANVKKTGKSSKKMLISCKHYNSKFIYSDNQKTLIQEDGQIAILQVLEMMLGDNCGNFPRVFSQAATFQIFPSRSAWPQSVLAAALGSMTHPSRSARPPPHYSLRCFRGPNLTFGKLPLGKLHIFRGIVATWKIT